MTLVKAKDPSKSPLGNGHARLLSVLLDSSRPPEVSAKLLLDLVQNSTEHTAAVQALLTDLFKYLAKGAASAEAEQLKTRYEQAIAELEHGPPIPATFISPAEADLPGLEPRAHVVTFDGQHRFPLLHPKLKLENLECGFSVYLDSKGAVVLGYSQKSQQVGQEATFLRNLPGTSLIEAKIRDEPFVVYGTQSIIDAVKQGKLKRNNKVLVCPRREIAFQPIPAEDDMRYRFIDESKVPEVIAARDIGKPHWVLGYLIRRTRVLLYRPDLYERFDLRPRIAAMLTGPSGTGKTLTIKAFLYEFHKMLVQRTGRKDLGSRLVHARLADLLSPYLGESDQNMDRLFRDLYAIASEKVQTADGESIYAPCVLLLEEAEGIARRRGADFDSGAYDRILGTLLQRLDDPTDDLGKFPIILLTTTNRPDLFDVAMWRRLASIRAAFTRLDKEGLAAVLGKKLKPNYPYASCNGTPRQVLRSRLLDQVVSAFFSPNGDDRGLVELTLRDGKKITKSARHFLTGSIVEQAVANAIDQLVFTAEETGEDVGLTAAGLLATFRNQIDGVADNLTPHNAGDYVDLPEHAHVAQVRRLRGSGGLAELVVNDH